MLSQFLQDPTIIEMSRARSKGRTRSPRRERRSPSIMTLALIEEERQANHLKALLRSATDRIEYEIRRAEQAEVRAHYAVMREKELEANFATSDHSRRQAEVRAEEATSQGRMYLLKVESVEQELKRLRSEVQRLEKRAEDLEDSKERARDTSLQHRLALENYMAREKGREEARHLAIEKAYDEGREEGWDEGHDVGFEEGREEGYEEGRKVGRIEGIQEGKEQGKNEERRNALEAFDRFLKEDLNEYDDGVSKIQEIHKNRVCAN